MRRRGPCTPRSNSLDRGDSQTTGTTIGVVTGSRMDGSMCLDGSKSAGPKPRETEIHARACPIIEGAFELRPGLPGGGQH